VAARYGIPPEQDGKQLNYIPALNNQPANIEMMAALVSP